MSTPSSSAIATTAQAGFEAFRHGLATGNWTEFLDLLTDDFSFWFPVGQFQGLNVGKAKAAAFFQYVSQWFDQGLTLTVERVTYGDNYAIFEVKSEGQVAGHPYVNMAAIAFDIRGPQICGYREYLGVLYKVS